MALRDDHRSGGGAGPIDGRRAMLCGPHRPMVGRRPSSRRRRARPGPDADRAARRCSATGRAHSPVRRRTRRVCSPAPARPGLPRPDQPPDAAAPAVARGVRRAALALGGHAPGSGPTIRRRRASRATRRRPASQDRRVAVRLVDSLVTWLRRRIAVIRRILDDIFARMERFGESVSGTRHRAERIYRMWGEGLNAGRGREITERTLKRRLRCLTYGIKHVRCCSTAVVT